MFCAKQQMSFTTQWFSRFLCTLQFPCNCLLDSTHMGFIYLPTTLVTVERKEEISLVKYQKLNFKNT